MDITYSVLRKDSLNEYHHKFRLYRSGSVNYRYSKRAYAYNHRVDENHIVVAIIPLE